MHHLCHIFDYPIQAVRLESVHSGRVRYLSVVSSTGRMDHQESALIGTDLITLPTQTHPHTQQDSQLTGFTPIPGSDVVFGDSVADEPDSAALNSQRCSTGLADSVSSVDQQNTETSTFLNSNFKERTLCGKDIKLIVNEEDDDERTNGSDGVGDVEEGIGGEGKKENSGGAVKMTIGLVMALLADTHITLDGDG